MENETNNSEGRTDKSGEHFEEQEKNRYFRCKSLKKYTPEDVQNSRMMKLSLPLNLERILNEIDSEASFFREESLMSLINQAQRILSYFTQENPQREELARRYNELAEKIKEELGETFFLVGSANTNSKEEYTQAIQKDMDYIRKYRNYPDGSFEQLRAARKALRIEYGADFINDKEWLNVLRKENKELIQKYELERLFYSETK